MLYINTLMLTVFLTFFGILLYYLYQYWFEKKSVSLLSGKLGNRTLPRSGKLKRNFITICIFLIGISFVSDTLFIPYNRCANIETNRSVSQWESRFGSNSAYDMCFCAQGYPVFKNPSRAFTQLLIDNPEGVLKMSMYYWMPLSRYTYRKFMTYYNGAGYPTKDQKLELQLNRIKSFLDLFDNSYSKYLVPIDGNGNQTTMNGILDLEITEVKALGYAYLANGEKSIAEDGYTYMYVYYYLKNLLDTPYTVSSESISILENQQVILEISTIDLNQLNIDISGQINPRSVRTGLVVFKAKTSADYSLEYLDRGVSYGAFTFPIHPE